MDGSWVNLFHKWLEMTYSACAELRPGVTFQQTDWTYINSNHMCAQSSIEYLDLAVFASSPLYGEKCMSQRIPPDVDFVIVEFGINDFYYAKEVVDIAKDLNNQVGGGVGWGGVGVPAGADLVR